MYIYHKPFLTHVIVLLSSNILKVKVCFPRDDSSEHQDYMDMGEGTSGVRALSLSPMSSSNEQAVPQSATTLPKEPAGYVF